MTTQVKIFECVYSNTCEINRWLEEQKFKIELLDIKPFMDDKQCLILVVTYKIKETMYHEK